MYSRLWFIGFLSLSAAAQTTSYTISTFAGTGGTPGFSGDGGTATSAALHTPTGVALDASHNLYIADQANNRVRKVVGGKMSTFAGTGVYGFTGDGGAATSAYFETPTAVRNDSAGNLYIADYTNHLIREVTVSNGNISTVVGTPGGYGADGDGGPASNATLSSPAGLAFGPDGSLYIVDHDALKVRVVTPDGNINTFAGNGRNAFAGDGGLAINASLSNPNGIAVDTAGNVYIADTGNHRIRKVTPDGKITTIAGNGTPGFSGNGGLATAAQFNRPWDVAVDAAGDLYIADAQNNQIRLVNTSGIISTVAGNISGGYLGDGGAATSARLNFPTGVTLDPSAGLLYIADSTNACIRVLTPSPPAIGGSGSVATAAAFGGATAAAPGSWIEIYGSNLAIDARSWATSDFHNITAPTSLDGTSVTIGGQAAFVSYISGGQVNVQVPSNVTSGLQPVIVKTAAGSAAAYNLAINSVQPGLLAPASFHVNGTQYVTALFTDGTYVLPPNAIAGVNSRRAKAGDTIILYGVGFGPTSPNVPAGQIVQQATPLAAPVQVFFGSTSATVSFAGLAPSAVGLYQINVVVPSVTAGDNIPLSIAVGGAAGSQTLYTAVQ